MIAKDVQRFFKRLEDTLTVLARRGQHIELKARLKEYHKLLDAWLEVAPRGASPPGWRHFPASVDRFGGPLEIEFRAIIQAASLSNDTSTVSAVAEELSRGALACLRSDQTRLMEDFLSNLLFLYEQCIERAAFVDAIGHCLDSDLYLLLSSVRPVESDPEVAASDDPQSSASLDAVLRFGLALTNDAIRHGQQQHAMFFFERLFAHRKYRDRECLAVGPVRMGVAVIFDYVAIVLTGWSLHTLQEGVLPSTDAAHAVFRSALAQLPPIPVLVAEWELLRGSHPQEGALDWRLGIANWDVRDWRRDYRPGLVEVRTGSPDWVRLGLRASLLHASPYILESVETLFGNNPQRFIWDAAKERDELRSLASDRWLGIADGERLSRVEAAMNVIEQRARGANTSYLRYVLDSPLSDSRVSKLRDDASKAHSDKQSAQSALCRAGLGRGSVVSCPLRTRMGLWIPREYLLEDNNWGSGFGDHLGERIAVREAINFIHLIEESAAQAEGPESLETLPERVRDVRRSMTDAGFQPNVLILPQEDRFAGALFQKPLWQVEGRGEFGEASMGSWEQLHVLRSPTANPESILLLDSRRAIAPHEPSDDTPVIRIWIEDPPPGEEGETPRRAARASLASADGPLPESRSIQVLAWMEVIPRLGLADADAVRSIDIRSGCFAIVEGTTLYHRPTCSDIAGKNPTYVLRVERGDEKSPCPTCNPSRWNYEGRFGK